MVKKKDEEAGAAPKAPKKEAGQVKKAKEGAPKKEKEPTSKKGKSTEPAASVLTSERAKPSRVLNLKGKAPVNDYMAGIDLPPSDEEEEEEEGASSEDEPVPVRRERGTVPTPLNIQATERDLRKKEKKESQLAAAQTQAREEALKQDDDSAFSVVLGSKMASMEGEEGLEDKAKDIKIENFSVTARGKELYNNASITIVHGRRYGLVGPNGKGKSVLMKLLASRKLPVPKSIDVLLVEQEVVGDQRSALEAVVSADEELMRLREEEAKLKILADKEAQEEEGKEGNNVSLEKLTLKDAEIPEEEEDEDEVEDDKIADKKSRRQKAKSKPKKNKRSTVKEAEKEVRNEETEEGGLTAGERLANVYERMQLMGAASAESRASKILAGLGFTKDMQARPTQSFSGGWRMRISLARALYIQPTLLLLDEPTNHLDLRAVIWLEEYLMRWKKTLMVVSHDRDFLNSVCSDIIHLNDCKLQLYKGNFETFEQMYEQKRRENNKRAEVYEKQMNAAKRSGNKASMDKARERAEMKEARTKKKDKKGKGEEDDDAKPKEIPKKWREYTVQFHFPEPTELTPPLLQLINVEFQYPNRSDFALRDIDLGIDMGTRVAIVGPNGAGKSTILNLVAGDLIPTKGEARRSQKLRIGRYSQHFVDVLQFDETPVQYLLRLFPDQEGPSKQEAVRSKLGKFGLPSHNHVTPIVKLSGGQKARVVFTAISMSRPHILLLDEPTNHLDMQSIDALADALEEFTGGIVLVSHDSRLISRVCEDEERSEIWVVDNGTCIKYPGSFEEYKSELIKEIIAEVED